MADNSILLKMMINLLEEKRLNVLKDVNRAEEALREYQYPEDKEEYIKANPTFKPISAHVWFDNGTDEIGDHKALDVFTSRQREYTLGILKSELTDMLETI